MKFAMKNLYIILSLCMTVTSLYSCFGHIDGIIQERDISLCIVNDNLEEYHVSVKSDNGNRVNLSPENGLYRFETPKLRFSEGYILGITLNKNVNDIDDFFQVNRGNELILQLSCEDIWALPKDANGVSMLEF
jgi:hypothetical protein